MNKYYSARREEILAQQKAYRESNREKYNAYQREYRQRRRDNDPMYRLLNSTRARVQQVFRGLHKSKSTLEMLGCSLEFLKTHLESQFKPGMTWDNYGEWHIDHIVPTASAKNKEELEKLCHYNNLQPLWALENMKKSDNILQIRQS